MIFWLEKKWISVRTNDKSLISIEKRETVLNVGNGVILIREEKGKGKRKEKNIGGDFVERQMK